MMASTVAVVESGKAFRVAADVGSDDSAKNVLLPAIAYDENMGTSVQRPQNRRERNVQDI